MKLSRLPDLQRLRAECENPRLQASYDRAISHTLAGASDERLFHRFLALAMWVFLAFFVASGVIGILVALKLIEVDDKHFDLIWKTFVGSTATLIISMVSGIATSRTHQSAD